MTYPLISDQLNAPILLFCAKGHASYIHVGQHICNHAWQSTKQRINEMLANLESNLENIQVSQLTVCGILSGDGASTTSGVGSGGTSSGTGSGGSSSAFADAAFFPFFFFFSVSGTFHQYFVLKS